MLLLYWPDSMPKANSTDSGYAYCEFPFVLSNLSGVLLCNSSTRPALKLRLNGIEWKLYSWVESMIIHGLDFIKDQTIVMQYYWKMEIKKL